MLTLRTHSKHPAYNLALEQALFEALPPEEEALWLWQNEPSVIVGRHQDTAAEVDLSRARALGVHVVRRPSGGGAVYHDLGNVNFSYITRLPEGGRYDLMALTRPVLLALSALGVEGRISGRNDLCIGEAKFSGNAQLIQRGRVVHHGTLLFDTDLSRLSLLLTPAPEKLRRHGVPSARARVTNIRPHLKTPLSVRDFIQALEDSFRRTEHPKDYIPDAALLARVEALRRERYDAPAWNIGEAPGRGERRQIRFPGGTLWAAFDREGETLRNLRLYGDFFGAESVTPLESALEGVPLGRAALLAKLSTLSVGDTITGLTPEILADLLAGEV